MVRLNGRSGFGGIILLVLLCNSAGAVTGYGLSNIFTIDNLAVDTDCDGVADSVDNCRYLPNPDQNDIDTDGVGDICDNCPTNYDPSQSDVDGDGSGDICDICPAAANDLCYPDGTAVEVIDPETGGTIETPDGLLSIYIEPNDINETVTISVTQVEAPDANADLMIGTHRGWGDALAIYDLEPDGYSFESTVTVTLSFDSNSLNHNQCDLLGLYLWDDYNNRFVKLDADCIKDFNRPTLTCTINCQVELRHFSDYAVVLAVDWDTRSFGDFTSEGDIDIYDLSVLSADWLETDSIADIRPLPDGDNRVNFLDFAIMADNWQTEPVP